ncbi:MAG: tetratricopeptide repeat protein [Alphaproteobacteria bacterium]
MKHYVFLGLGVAVLRLWIPSAAAQTDTKDESSAVEKSQTGDAEEFFNSFPKFDLKEVWANIRESKLKADPEYRIQVFESAKAQHHDGDGKIAVKLFTELAEHGDHTESMLWLSRMAFRGEGQPKSPEVAFKWSSKAAAKGNVQAMLQTGGFFYEGIGTPKSLSSARHWFLYAADRGSDDADEHLLEMYDKGEGGAADPAMAIVFGKRLAKRYDVDGLFYMGKAYRDGAGVDQDLAKAREYLEAATEYEHPGAAEELAKLSALEAKTTKEPSE